MQSEIDMRGVKQFDVSHEIHALTCMAGDHIVTSGEGPWIFVHSLKDGSVTTSVKTPSRAVWDVEMHGGFLYVTENGTENGRVFVYDEDFNLTRTILVGYRECGGVAVTDGCMYVTSADENLVYQLNMKDVETKQVFVQSGLSDPHFIAANSSHVAVSCYGNHTVVVFGRDGRKQFVYGGRGNEPGKLICPRGVAFDHFGRILVSDNWNVRISIMTRLGRHLQDIAVGKDGLKYPKGIAVTKKGQILVGCETIIAVYGSVEAESFSCLVM